MRLYYQLTNIEPLVLSQSTATTNNHLGLDYVPGSAVLGAIASKIYGKLTPEQSFDIFHSGKVAFGPAYPLVGKQIALPVPASWHVTKNNPNDLTNHSSASFERNSLEQYKQLRAGYINHEKKEAQVLQDITTRTALDKNLRVKDGQLYTYSSIRENQNFAGWIETDSEELLSLLKPFLDGELSIGRSRSSEFGLVKLSLPSEQPATAKPQNLGKELVVWCLSDAQMLNELGLPTFTPDAKDLDRALQGKLNLEKSFIRTNKLRRFNRARGGLDTEQQLILAGSVLVFDLEVPADERVLQNLAEKGMGINRQQGLGWISVNPNWANHSNPTDNLFAPLEIGLSQESRNLEVSNSNLIQWVSKRGSKASQQAISAKNLQKLHQLVARAYENIRAYKNHPRDFIIGPSQSQWRRLDQEVKGVDSWQQKAFEGDARICKAKNDEYGWGASWQAEEGYKTFADFTKQTLADLSSTELRKFLEDLCRFDPSKYGSLMDYKKAFADKNNQGADE